VDRAADVKVEMAIDRVAVGIVVAKGCTVAPAPEGLERAIAEAVARPADDEAVRKDVRDLLRFGKYKPTGRGKPASEYLVNAAREARFPRINNLVDINNLVSLETQLPISLIDVGLAETDRFQVRRGRAGEQYVFNSAGQSIDLEDLLLVSRLPADVACANPVKDSMATKLTDASKDVFAVLYAPVSLMALLERATDRFLALVKEHSGAADTTRSVARS
jgi:DNA/RNA-binding domain of Phe-tRNA-synthetase-like protein